MDGLATKCTTTNNTQRPWYGAYAFSNLPKIPYIPQEFQYTNNPTNVFSAYFIDIKNHLRSHESLKNLHKIPWKSLQTPLVIVCFNFCDQGLWSHVLFNLYPQSLESGDAWYTPATKVVPNLSHNFSESTRYQQRVGDELKCTRIRESLCRLHVTRLATQFDT